LVADDFTEIAEINDCRSLFLTDFREGDRNSLQVFVEEGLPDGTPVAMKVGGMIIPNCTLIEDH